MEQKQQHSSGFLNGLLLGIVIGAGLVLLLTTKKGKRILKTISEDGLDSISNLEDLYMRFEKALHEDDSPVKAPEQTTAKTFLATPEVVETVKREEVVEPAPVAVPEVATVTAPVVAAAVPTPEVAPEPVITAPVVNASVPEPEVESPVEEEENDYVPQKPRIIAVDHETSAKLAEMQARLDREIHAVSEAIASNYVPYADDDMEEEEPVQKAVKATRRRFFRGIPRRA